MKMTQNVGKNNNKVYRLVLTGGPCGGKTTGQSRLCTFFENIGWKVYRVPETATVLMGGGVKWTDLAEEEIYRFQENLIKTMLQVESTFFDLASSCNQNCLVICDRGAMDASAYLQPAQWERMKRDNGWNEIELRDTRYNQVLHLVSAAHGAEAFYGTHEHATRYEGLDMARNLDQVTSQAWVGHPYFDVIDNSTDFERKVTRMISAVCNRLGIDAGDRLSLDSRKRKFLVSGLPDELAYPQFQDFIVVHDYLVTPNQRMQARIRRRGQSVESVGTSADPLSQHHFTVTQVTHNEVYEDKFHLLCNNDDFSNWTYTHTIRRPEINHESPELKMQISVREYELLIAQKDIKRYTVYKKRRCFLWNNHYFQMDIYEEPCHPRCHSLIILETYTTLKGDALKLPTFLNIVKEVTDDPYYSMYNLARIDESAAKTTPKPLTNGIQAHPKELTNGVQESFKSTNQKAELATNGMAHLELTNGVAEFDCENEAEK